ncbi:MAG: NUDIX hydrolase [Gammaproteobacteria bacterium]
MAVEYLDVVDAQDHVIQQRPRSDVHRHGLRHRAAHVLVFDAAGRLLLQKRSATKDWDPGLWDSSASGHVNAGESYARCAVRELEEEIGLYLTTPPKPLFKLQACCETRNEFVWVYRCVAHGPLILNPLEIEAADWFTPDELEWLATRPENFTPSFRLIRARAGAHPRP